MQTQNKTSAVAPPPPPSPSSPEELQNRNLNQNGNTRTKAGGGGAAGCISDEKFDAVVSGTVQQPTTETAVSTTMKATKEQKDQINSGLFAPARVLKFLLGELKSKLNGLLPASSGKSRHDMRLNRIRLQHQIIGERGQLAWAVNICINVMTPYTHFQWS